MTRGLTLSFKMLRIAGLKQMLAAHLNDKAITLSRALPLPQTPANFYAGWGRKKSGRTAQKLATKNNVPFYLLEDGFIRSLYPPPSSHGTLSLVIDDVGIYYDARKPSRLENILTSDKAYSAEDIKRARSGIRFLRTHKISKYNHAPDALPSALPDDYILLIDQTYGDLSIAGALASADDFTTMLDTAISEHPEAPIILKVHPQTISGKKRGYLYNAYRTLPKESRKNIHVVSQNINPFTLIESAKEVYTVSSQMGFEALLCDKKVTCFGMPFYAGWGLTTDKKTCPRRNKSRTLEDIFAAFYFDYSAYYNPLSGKATSFEDIAELMALWREHEETYSAPAAALHMSLWKRPAMNVFLGTQSSAPHYFMDEDKAMHYAATHNAPLYVWSSRMSETLEKNCDAQNIALTHIEDGFLRSKGLGAKLTPPCSLCFDDVGMYYDAMRPSEIENMLNILDIDDGLKTRAKNLIAQITHANLSKYNLSGAGDLAALTHKVKQANRHKIILVTGQVEDDASVKLGGNTIGGNLGLLKAVREKNTDAFIIYKPHPDVMAGLRAGHIDRAEIEALADDIIADADIIALIDVCDEVHVNTSLAGFEALLRGKTVHCYGMPFYAGWGLTTDRITCERRTAERSLEELVAITLILYPRYIHPRAMRPCRAEDIADWLSNDAGRSAQKPTLSGMLYSAYGKCKARHA